jgi:hypothetical protein
MGNLLTTTQSINQGVAVLNANKIQGFVLFTQKDTHVSIHVEVTGLTPNHKH